MQISRREVLFSQHKSLFPKVRHVFGAFTTRSSQRDLNTCPQIRKLLTRLQCPLVSRETSRERELGLLGFCAALLLRCSAMTANLEEQSAAVSQSPKAGDTVQTIEQDAAKREAGL